MHTIRQLTLYSSLLILGCGNNMHPFLQVPSSLCGDGSGHVVPTADLTYNQTRCCNQGWPYLADCILSHLQEKPTNWEVVGGLIQNQQIMVHSLSFVATTDIKWWVQTLAKYMVPTFNSTHKVITLCTGESFQMRKVVLQRMASDICHQDRLLHVYT